MLVHSGAAEEDEMGSRTAAQFKVRLPEGLMDWVRAQAQTNCRSINGEIEYRLTQAQAADQSGRATGAPVEGIALRA